MVALAVGAALSQPPHATPSLFATVTVRHTVTVHAMSRLLCAIV